MNRNKKPRVEPEHTKIDDYIFSADQLTPEETAKLALDLAAHLKLEVWRTNKTKHGDTQLEFRPASD